MSTGDPSLRVTATENTVAAFVQSYVTWSCQPAPEGVNTALDGPDPEAASTLSPGRPLTLALGENVGAGVDVGPPDAPPPALVGLVTDGDAGTDVVGEL